MLACRAVIAALVLMPAAAIPSLAAEGPASTPRDPPDRVVRMVAERLLHTAIPGVTNLLPFGATDDGMAAMRAAGEANPVVRWLARADLDRDGTEEIFLTALSSEDPAGEEGGGVLIVLRKLAGGYRPIYLRRHGYPHPAMEWDPKEAIMRLFTPETDLGIAEFRWDEQKGAIVTREQFASPEECEDPPCPASPKAKPAEWR